MYTLKVIWGKTEFVDIKYNEDYSLKYKKTINC